MQSSLTVFVLTFLAELGDKTQIAALLFAASAEYQPYTVFLSASLALIASTAIAVALGATAERYLAEVPLKLIAGIGFVSVGLWSISEHFRHA